MKKDYPSIPTIIQYMPTMSDNNSGPQKIMVYPPPPSEGGISINVEDYASLHEDNFLNDEIIDFYLKYFMNNVLSEEDRKRTHIFSSYFYKRLTKSFNDDPRLTLAERRHRRVREWTKSVDIFDKDFIIIPIRKRSHVFLGIVCFPHLTGPVLMSDNTPISKNKDDNLNEDGGEDTDLDKADADGDDLEPNTTDQESVNDEELLDEATPRVSKVKPCQEPIKQPCILIFDSLSHYANHSRVFKTLREYLQVEWKRRNEGETRDFSENVFKGAVPKVPQQTNFVDCGPYLLQYVEAFFKNPITDYRMPIRSIKDWFPVEEVSRKRYYIMKSLLKLMEEQNIDIARLNLPNLNLGPNEYENEEEVY